MSFFSKKAITITTLAIATGVFGVGFYLGMQNTAVAELVKDTQNKIEQQALAVQPIDNSLRNLFSNSAKSTDIDFNLFWDVWETTKKYHIQNKEISDQELFYGSLKGIVDSVNDPYSTYFNPEQAKSFAEDLSGKFEGVGIHIGIKNDRLTIIAPLDGSPGDKAGLKAGDTIFFIDKYDTTGISIDEAVNRIRGQKGTSVTLSILHEGGESVEEVTVTRDTIVIKSFELKKLELPAKETYYYFKIASFNEEVDAQLNSIAKEIRNAKPSGLILDLRNNPGGLLDLSVKVASLWIQDSIIVSEEYSDGRVANHNSTGTPYFKDIPTIVLVNQGSASASEILAGALQDYNKATLIGEQTFGKGSVQSLFEFQDKSAAKITIAHWLTPKGRKIEGTGITPDTIVALTLQDFLAKKDPQLDKAKELIIGEKK